jgi:antitoxin YefM
LISDADYTAIARRDAPNAVIVSQEYFDSLTETVRLLKVPANAAHLQKSIDQYRAGKAKARKLASAQTGRVHPRGQAGLRVVADARQKRRCAASIN